MRNIIDGGMFAIKIYPISHMTRYERNQEIILSICAKHAVHFTFSYDDFLYSSCQKLPWFQILPCRFFWGGQCFFFNVRSYLPKTYLPRYIHISGRGVKADVNVYMYITCTEELTSIRSPSALNKLRESIMKQPKRVRVHLQ